MSSSEDELTEKQLNDFIAYANVFSCGILLCLVNGVEATFSTERI